jgi:transmembrane sensor
MTDDRAQRSDLDAEWEVLARFLAGESDPEEARRLRERLAREPERAELVRALDAALTVPPAKPLSADEVEAALASVMARRDRDIDMPSLTDASEMPPERRKRPAVPDRAPSFWRAPALRAAAAVLILAGATFVWRGQSTSSGGRSPVASLPPAASSFTTAVGRVDTIALVDGTRVILGPASALRPDDGYGTRTRDVTLRGLAYFDVVHDSTRPFVVHTASATLRDVGTSFAVREDSTFGTRVVVTSGAVSVASGARPDSATVLQAGDRAEVTTDTMRVERGVAEPGEVAWTRGVLTFRDAPLSLVAVELRRWYGVVLVVDEPSVASRRLTASFDRASADDVGRVLGAVLGTTATRSGDTLHLGERASVR